MEIRVLKKFIDYESSHCTTSLGVIAFPMSTINAGEKQQVNWWKTFCNFCRSIARTPLIADLLNRILKTISRTTLENYRNQTA